MPLELTIEQATRKQHDDVVWSLSQELLADGTTYVFRADTSRRQMLDYWFPTIGETHIASRRGSPVGLYALRPNHPGRGAHVANASFFVSGKSRSRGVGRALCEHAIETARQRGYRAMAFNLVVATNAGAIALWRNLGFRTVGTIPEAFEHETLGFVDALVMYRRLDGPK